MCQCWCDTRGEGGEEGEACFLNYKAQSKKYKSFLLQCEMRSVYAVVSKKKVSAESVINSVKRDAFWFQHVFFPGIWKSQSATGLPNYGHPKIVALLSSIDD